MSLRKNIIDMARSIPVGDDRWIEKFLNKLCSDDKLYEVLKQVIKEKDHDPEERGA